MGKVVTQEDLFTLLRDIEQRLARLETTVFELSKRINSIPENPG